MYARGLPYSGNQRFSLVVTCRGTARTTTLDVGDDDYYFPNRTDVDDGGDEIDDDVTDLPEPQMEGGTAKEANNRDNSRDELLAPQERAPVVADGLFRRLVAMARQAFEVIA